MHVKSLKARSAVSVAALAAIGATGLVAAPAASAAPAATAQLAVNAPLMVAQGTSLPSLGSLEIDNGTSVTCITLNALDPRISIAEWRVYFTSDYQVSAGTSYKVSALEGPCEYQTGRSLGSVNVTPTEADVSSGVYWVRIS